MAMTPKERATLAGRARANSQTPAQRSALARRAYLAGAFNTVISRIPDLTLDQLAQLNAALGEVKRNDR